MLVIDPGEPQNDVRYAFVLRTDHRFSGGFRFRIRPARIDRLVLVNALARATRASARAWCSNKQIALLRTPAARAGRRVPSTLTDLVERIVLAGKVEIGDKVDDAGDA